jgi:hypothetical protein
VVLYTSLSLKDRVARPQRSAHVLARSPLLRRERTPDVAIGTSAGRVFAFASARASGARQVQHADARGCEPTFGQVPSA